MKKIEAIRQALRDGPMKIGPLRDRVEQILERPVSARNIAANCGHSARTQHDIIITGPLKERMYALAGKARKEMTIREIADEHAPTREQLIAKHMRSTLAWLERTLRDEYECITPATLAAIETHREAVQIAVSQ